MTTIRSAPPPMIPPRPANDARAAFFKAVASPEATAVQAPPAVAPRTETRTPQPNQILRPGSFIDIKV